MMATTELSETKGVSPSGANLGRTLPVGSVECNILLRVANRLMGKSFGPVKTPKNGVPILS